jgi:hypothetical protein
MHSPKEYYATYDGQYLAGPFLLKEVAWQWLTENRYKFASEEQANYWKYLIVEADEDVTL